MNAHIEPLENRRLLSFSTVDIVPGGELWGGMAADASGNVYVGGFDATHTVVRKGSNGGTTWTNILELPSDLTDAAPDFEVTSVAASPAGDVYARVDDLGPNWSIWQRPVGDSQFHQVHSGSGYSSNSLSVDLTGKAYAVTTVPVTVQLPGKKTTTQFRTAVARQTTSLGSFAIVDTLGASERIAAICASTQGVYVVGNTSSSSGGALHWFVRKSASGNPGTWSTVVTDYQYDQTNNLNSFAQAVTIKANGEVLVAGTGYKRVRTGGTDRKPIYSNMPFSIVRSSSDGGASWLTEVTSGTPQNTLGIASDATGNVYIAAGSGNDSIVQSKPAGASTWTTIDQFAIASPEGGIVADSNGNVYVSGEAWGPEAQSYPYGIYGFVRMMPAAAAPVSSGSFAGAGGVSSTSIADELFV